LDSGHSSRAHPTITSSICHAPGPRDFDAIYKKVIMVCCFSPQIKKF
jgi:hypothetical protein